MKLRHALLSLALAALALPAQAADASTAQNSAKTIAALKTRIAALRLEVARAKAYDQVENLFDIFGYYVDKNQFAQEADLWARKGTMEMAQRGVYVGQDSVRRFHAADREGPNVNRLLDHPMLGQVIHVSPDGKSAKVRARMWQMMGGPGARATLGGGVYENEAILEDGVWKIQSEHTYNTYVAGYDVGPATSSPTMPGPNPNVPPDLPTTVKFEGFPKVYDIPIHYKNPVSGR